MSVLDARRNPVRQSVMTKRFVMPDEKGRRTSRKKVLRSSRPLRTVIDFGLAIVFVVLMTTATVEEFAHEWLGMAIFVLFFVHQLLNRRWWMNLFKGRITTLRAVETVVNLGLVLCMLGQIVSCLVISKYALWWLPALDGAWWARFVHLVCSYWGFVLASVHAGLHLVGPARILARRGGALLWVVRIVIVGISCFGVWSFVQLDLAAYMTASSQFVFVDPTTPLIQTAVEYASVGVLLATVAHCVTMPLRAARRSDVHRNRKRSVE